MTLPRKCATAEQSPSSTSNALDAGQFKLLPELWAFLTQLRWEDGTNRQPGRLSLSLVSGRLALSLQDAETGQYACLEGTNPDDLLLLCEQLLSEERMPWRISRYGTGKRK